LNFLPSGYGHREFVTGVEHLDDLSRDVYGVLGIPIDAVDLSEVVHRIGAAMRQEAPFLISTPNLNFLVTSQADTEFRESLLRSDLCPVDGVPIVWIARLLGIPLRTRVAGSDIFDRLKLESRHSVKAFLFGGPEGVAETCGKVLNAQPNGVVCVGTLYPGFGAVQDMSTDAIIDQINASKARFLVASLGAQKGQSWLLHNHHRLQIPVRSHLGAAINFQAGLLKRAPLFVRRLGFEWLWRIKEEPHLWKRYLHDGGVLLRLMVANVLPLAVSAIWQCLRREAPVKLTVFPGEKGPRSKKIFLAGDATAEQVESAVPVFREAIADGDEITIDVSRLRALDARFLGFFLMIRKQTLKHGGRLRFSGVSPRFKRIFRLNGFGFLLNSGGSPAIAQTYSPALVEVAAEASSSAKP
jgi:N-acetylglucosaminyldiphosphoundecaprenol N-acetyl-beta-D-mannosaminyltransferase